MDDKLIAALRTCVDKDKDCSECPYFERCMHNTSSKTILIVMVDAADAIEKLNKRIDFLMNCIHEAEDSLDRGVDNDLARAALEKADREKEKKK